jgi:hypothetical protein
MVVSEVSNKIFVISTIIIAIIYHLLGIINPIGFVYGIIINVIQVIYLLGIILEVIKIE